MTDNPKYDVAISFLAIDATMAKTFADKLEETGFKVFFFPRNQEELAGTNGMETMRAPFFDSRINVVLFKKPWGQTPWTRIEQTAITERCLETGWDSLMFVQLDNSTVPRWLPTTHVRFAFQAYGIEQLIGAIKARIQEQGGVITPPDAASEAKRIKREADYHHDRDALMRDRKWIENVVHRSIRDAFRRVEELVAHANKEHDFQIVIGTSDYRTCIMRAGYVSLGVAWEQPIYNTVLNVGHGDCYLRVAEFSGLLVIPGRNEMVWQQPTRLKERRFRPDVTEGRELVWILGNEHIAPSMLADRIVMILLDLIGRMNAGKVQRPSL